MLLICLPGLHLLLRRLSAACAAWFLIAANGNAQVNAAAPLQTQVCPAEVAKESQCVTGTDNAGATYWLVMPPNWSGTLVVPAHGGPTAQFQSHS